MRRRRAKSTGFLAAGFATVAYAYAGYPLLVTALARRRGGERPAGAGRDPLPSMSVVVCAFDEAGVIAQKLDDVTAQGYPDDRLEVIVVADGSQDATPQIAADKGVKVLFDPVRAGKSAAVNRGIAAATGEIVCLTDANCLLAAGALRALARAFDDPRVAIVGGAKQVHGDGARGAGEGLYWRVESYVREQESKFGATLSAPGEIFAIRRRVAGRVPPGVICDDYHLLCDALSRGHRALYEREAVAREEVSLSVAEELERRTRMAAGTWQTTLAHLRLADPRRGFVALAFISHRVLRNLVVPVLLPLLWAGCLVAGRRHRAARLLFDLQCAVYAAAAAGAVRDERLFAAPFQFALVNVATLRGAFRFLTRRQPATWKRARRNAA